MPAKRPHRKSRNGCRTCRLRRVKCDEVHPRCGPCTNHSVFCFYDRAEVIPRGRSTSAIAQLHSPDDIVTPPPWFGHPPDRRKLELQLMNTFTYMHMIKKRSSDPRVQNVWAHEVPQMAIDCDYLMSALLSAAALNIHIHNPHEPRMRCAAHDYFGLAVCSLRPQLAQINSSNAVLVFAASCLIAFQTSAQWMDPCEKDHRPYQLPVQWLQMEQGMGRVARTAGSLILLSGMKGLVHSVPAGARGLSPSTTTPEPDRKLTMFTDFAAAVAASNPSDEEERALTDTFHKITRIYRGMRDGDSLIFIRGRILIFAPSLQQKFIEMLEMNDPRAIILLAYFFAAMKPLEEDWWTRGRAEYEVRGIATLLAATGPEWRRFVEWPLQWIEYVGEKGGDCDFGMIQ
ncbi:hypothetical protein K402DRAFT_343659 [Aulographum hederae CBS 113979]|uniref:Zn(2)-C6 fungal-type domain-containing protein n=1 Tax=Aulographum hederae CBS 113979 TaxID=1176131 RepID=A0A6G1GJ33_9PEZI|nr:hypothetical protein K402DRAFT_343659 [Aulographum hederae CBS 113979]